MNAVTKQRELNQSPREGFETRVDGGMVVTEEQLIRFGNGDAKAGRRELRLLLALDRDGPVMTGPTARPDKVRIAGPQDEIAILELFLMDLRENAAHIAPIDEDKCMLHIQSGTRRRGGIVGVIDGPDGKPVAMTILIPMSWHWSNGWFLQELVNFVHPDHRKSRHIDDLLDFIKWSSDELTRGMGSRMYVLCGVLGAWRVRAKAALYRRKFAQAGIACVYPAPPVRGN